VLYHHDAHMCACIKLWYSAKYSIRVLCLVYYAAIAIVLVIVYNVLNVL